MSEALLWSVTLFVCRERDIWHIIDINFQAEYISVHVDDIREEHVWMIADSIFRAEYNSVHVEDI